MHLAKILIGDVMTTFKRDFSFLDKDDIKKNIDDIVNLIQSQQNVLEFLSENKNMWNVQNGKIQFDDDILLNQYNQLLLAVQ